jgi:hypothetical protein
MEQAYEAIVKNIESNRLGEALDQLLAFVQAYSPEREAAVRIQRSEWNALEEEALIMGETSSIREQRAKLKLLLLRLADAIKKDAPRAEAANLGLAGQGGADFNPPPFSAKRGEGSVNVFLSYAPEDQEGKEGLIKSMALLRHTRRVEIFDQHQSPAGNRQAALMQALEQAEIIIILLSHNYTYSSECLVLQAQAQAAQQHNRAAVVPILYRPVEWGELEIGGLQPLPRNGRFITQWPNADEAYALISRELGELAKVVRQRLDYTASSLSPLPPPSLSDQPKRAYDTAELRSIFRQGDPGSLIQQLITLTDGDNSFYDRALLLEQRWKEIRTDEQYNTASMDNLIIRKNQLNRDLLELIREMEGGAEA